MIGRNVPHLEKLGRDGRADAEGQTATPNITQEAGENDSNAIHGTPAKLFGILRTRLHMVIKPLPRTSLVPNAVGICAERWRSLKSSRKNHGASRVREDPGEVLAREPPPASARQHPEARANLPQILVPETDSGYDASDLSDRPAIYRPYRVAQFRKQKGPR